MSEKELLDGLPPYLFGAAATISFVLALYLALHDRIKASALLGGLAFVAALLAYLPQLESLSAFAVNVKLRQSLDRADEILTKIRNLSVLNARLAYMTMAWGNRWGTPPAREKQELLDAFDRQLIELKVGEQERAELAKPHLQLIAVDLFHIFNSVLNRRLSSREAELGAQLSRMTSDNPELRRPLQQAIQQLVELRSQQTDILHDPNLLDLKAVLKSHIPKELLEASDVQKLTSLAEQIGDLFEGCRKRAGFTQAAAEFYEKYIQPDAQKEKYKELFGEAPPF